MPLSCGAAASTTPRTKARGATRGRGAAPAAPAALEAPLPVGGPGGSADEAPQRLDQQVSEMNESYARKLRQFMAERASERLQSHRRVVQLEVQLEGAISGAHRGRAGPGPPDGSTGGGGGGARPDGYAAESYDGGLHAHAAEAEAASSYAHRLAQLAADRSREEQRHLDEIARLRTQVLTYLVTCLPGYAQLS